MLFHRKTPMAEPYCNYWRKSSNFTTIGRLHRDCFPMSLHHSTRDSRFCTSSNKSTPFYEILSFVQFFPRHCVPYLSFWNLSLFCHKQEFSVTFCASIPSCKHGGSFISTETLLILFQVFFDICFACGWNYGRNLSTLTEMKLKYDKLILESISFDFKVKFSHDSVYNDFMW